MSILSVKNLEKSFGKNRVLKDISFEMEKGDVIAIIGPSGSGKSTLLRCINQLETINSGEVEICGNLMVTTKLEKLSPKEKEKLIKKAKTDEQKAEITDCKKVVTYKSKEELRKIRLCLGLVFQNFHLFPHFSVLRNITQAPVDVLGMDKAEAEKIALDLLDKMGLKDKADSYPYQLSGGQQQRVSIARALAMKPEILFFDEPTSALDPELIGEILKVLKQLANEKMSMVIVTHEMAFARDVADRVIFMDDGYIVEQGTPQEVFGQTKTERMQNFLARFNEQ